MRMLKRFATAMLVLVFMVSSAAADYNLEGYISPSDYVKSGKWKQVRDEEGELIGEGFDFSLRHRNKLFDCSTTSYEAFGPGKTDPYFNRVKGSDKQSTFRVYDIEKGQPFGIRAKNIRIWNQSRKKYDFIDVEIKATNWTEVKGYKRKYSPLVCFDHSPVPKIAYSGLRNLSLTQTFYKAGTRTPIKIFSNTTYMDIDDGQGVILNNVIDIKMSADTRLKMKGSRQKPSVYNPIATPFPYGDVRNNFGVAFETSKINMNFFDLNAVRGSENDEESWEKIWGPSARYTYFTAAGVVTILPPNKLPVITAERLYKGKVTSSNFNHYRGRATKLWAKFYDDDKDYIKTWYKIYKNGKPYQNGRVQYHKYYAERSVETPRTPGDYKIVWYAQDYKMEEEKVTSQEYNFRIIRPIKLWTDYSHQPAWDLKRNIFNYVNFEERFKCKQEMEEYLGLSGPVRPRRENVFWSSENIGVETMVMGGDAASLESHITLPSGIQQALSLSKGEDGIWRGEFELPESARSSFSEIPKAMSPVHNARVIVKDLNRNGEEFDKTIELKNIKADIPLILDDLILYDVTELAG